MNTGTFRHIGLSTWSRATTSTQADEFSRTGRQRIALVFGLIVVLGVFAGRCLVVARTDTITFDEVTHLQHGLRFWMTGDDGAMWRLGAPRLPHVSQSLASYLILRESEERLIEEIVAAGDKPVIFPARCVSILTGLCLLLLVFWGVARSQGAWLGLGAAGVLSMVPEVLAHSSIAGSDMSFTAAGFLSVVLLARFAERPSMSRWVAVALAVGLAWSARHTALLLIPVAVFVHLFATFRVRRPQGVLAWVRWQAGSALASVFLGMVSFLILWAGDGLGVVSEGDMARAVPFLGVPERVGGVDFSAWPVPTSLVSLLKQVEHQKYGHPAYLLGSRRTTGWPLYFPLAIALKTPVGLLMLWVLAFVFRKGRGALELVCLGAGVVFWAALIRSTVDIGLRYALLTYPLAMPFVARLLEPAMLRDRVWGKVTVVAAAWLAIASIGAHPRYLSSFNEIGGGPKWGWLYLADSNVDWGQDVDALAFTLRQRGIHEATMDLWTLRRLDAPGFRALAMPAWEPKGLAMDRPKRERGLWSNDGRFLPITTRFVAVSATNLVGTYTKSDMSWLWTREVLTRVGDSIFVFDMDKPSRRSFAP